MKSFSFLTFILFFVFTSFILSQSNPRGKSGSSGKRLGGKIIGHVFDEALNTAIEYSNIVLINSSDSSNITGTITNKEGMFEITKIRPGNYYLDVRFMGYKTKRFDDIILKRGQKSVDLGRINLEQKLLNMEGINVIGERSAIEYKIDKKVINVSKQYTATSGNVVDILENVPSVSVDIEGNVSLRGSSNFTVLIDNRPTVLDASEALDQIPASAIEDIEIITNPSAMYDPDGPSGIINLVMKKQGYSGSSGTINLNTGFDKKYGGDFLLNYKTGVLTTFIGGDYNRRFRPGDFEEENITTINDKSSFINSSGSSDRNRLSYGFRGGLNLDFNKDKIGISFRIGDRESERTLNKDYVTWSNLDDEIENYTNNSYRIREGNFYGINFDYSHRFETKGHELSGRVSFRHRDMSEKSTNELLNSFNSIESGRIINEKGPGGGYRINVDYVYPISETNTFRMGYQNRLGNSEDNTSLLDYNQISKEYINLANYNRDIKYRRYIHSLYSMYSAEINKFGIQGGFRAEYTDREINLVKTNEDFIIDRWDYFPSAHFSYKHSDENQFFTSYTKRIVRPRGWNLEPFETWVDAYNLRIGNPDLQPEKIDSYEAGYQHYFANNLFSLEAYYRKTNNKIEYIKSAYDENVTLQTVRNVGNDFSFGLEAMFDINLTNWWKINLMGDLFSYEVEGVYNNKDFSRKSTNWKTRINNTLNLGNSTKLQFNNTYKSASTTSQGKVEGYFVSSIALKQEILKNLTATLQFRDVFSSAKREFTSEGVGFYNYSLSTHDAPTIRLNLNYNINNYKSNEKNKQNGVNGNESDDDDF